MQSLTATRSPLLRKSDQIVAGQLGFKKPNLRRNSPYNLENTRFSIKASQERESVQTPMSSATTPPHPVLRYTSFEGNSFNLQFLASHTNVLVDPWLVDTLSFGGLEFMFKGTKRLTAAVDVDKIAAETDVILLTMSIDDHSHRPTLRRLPKHIPVVASPSAAAVVRDMGYTEVIELKHGKQASVANGRMTVTATVGALTGPPWSTRQNGFVLKETVPDGIRMYYEPHCDYAVDSVASVGQVDIVVTPPSTQSLLGAYDLVKGSTDNIALLKSLRPKAVVPLLNAEFDATGPLNRAIVERGGVDDLQREMRGVPELESVKLYVPTPGEPLSIEL